MGQQPRTFDALKGQLLANLAEMLVRQLEEKWVRTLQVREGHGVCVCVVGGGVVVAALSAVLKHW